ncbi:MAG: ferritin-like domain-containing protein [Elusimicrobiota bacterium]|nr:ferritin-like domain-containing protein [Elusimicrobiota bacterium]
MTKLRSGSREHKDLMCRFFTDSFLRFNPDSVDWPDLPPADVERLTALPVWEEAVKTEATTALLVQSFGKKLKDPDLKEAVSMNGFEEGRHAALLSGLTRRYGIAVEKFDPTPDVDAEWGFLKVGYGECFDSFFGFGLFALARDSGYFSPALVKIFDPIMQEEARHIIFHANWVSYSRAQQPSLEQLAFSFKQALALGHQSASRIKTALRMRNSSPQDNFTMNAHESFGNFSVKQFLETCLRENARRLAPYDDRLLRPTFMPRLARGLLPILP